MKKYFKRLLSIILAVMIAFSTATTHSMAISAPSSDEHFAIGTSEGNPRIVSANESEKTFFQHIIDFFKNLFEKIRDLFSGYANIDVYEYVNPSFDLAGLDDGFVPQGVCYVDELEVFAVSGYVDGDISRIYLIDPQTNISKRINLLGYKGHAGGIASRGKDIWVSSSYQVYHLSTDAIKDAPATITIPFDGSFKSEVKGSFLCCSDDMLWVGEFYNKDYDVKESHACGKNRAWAAGYKISSNIHPNNGKPEQADVILSIPDEIQGMSITDEGYVLFSSSYGRTNDSKLYIYDAYENWAMDEDKGVYFPRWRNNVGKLKMPTLMEGMDYHNDRLFIAFESGAQKYSDAKEIIEYAWEVDINTIIKDLKKCSLRTAFSIL